MDKTLRALLFHKTSIHILTILILGFLVYSNTLTAPFEFDDKRTITDNPAIKGFRFFKNPSVLQEVDTYKEVKKFFESRYIGYLFFAVNYKIHGLDVAGYHIFNITVHILNALLGYWLIILTFRTPFFNGLQEHKNGNLIAFFSAFIFVVHPIQTQAVTYISQRFASLATLFYLFSLIFYIKSRLMTVSGQGNDQKTRYIKFTKWGYYYGSVISAVLAMKTKEISFTLPMMIALYEFMFLYGNIKKRLAYLTPILLTMLIIPLTLMSVKASLTGSGNIDEFELLSSPVISRWDYLFTQFRVIVTYIRLLFLPINQNFDYDYLIYHSFFALPVLSSFLFLLSIVVFGIYLLYRSRRSVENKGYLRLMSFGIFWFFITLAVESSIIPRADVIFEHRLYLSSIGFIIAVIMLFLQAADAFAYRIRIIIPMLIIVVIAFSVAAYARNAIWQDEVSLWKDTTDKSPNKVRTHYNLGAAYAK
ncbi:MAG: hypothetical protein HY957_01080 [Nitrospirae bacterium]|nr:hypothetical protein [Nitrospirota bacterium]